MLGIVLKKMKYPWLRRGYFILCVMLGIFGAGVVMPYEIFVWRELFRSALLG